nr:MAG TPA: hypothetical protein [Caudoviricetes sp.]DAS87384.1 MAG TPA: hypothetical protein [Caudoviricetes sp.]DAU32374.1 MAG TPA: hypothetical protein [Caudoviricetes sp.]
MTFHLRGAKLHLSLKLRKEKGFFLKKSFLKWFSIFALSFFLLK